MVARTESLSEKLDKALDVGVLPDLLGGVDGPGDAGLHRVAAVNQLVPFQLWTVRIIERLAASRAAGQVTSQLSSYSQTPANSFIQTNKLKWIICNNRSVISSD